MKRLIDVAAAGMGLLFFSPILLVLALLVWLDLGSPVFFRQVRPGLNGKPFTLIKFRTMKQLPVSDGAIVPDEQALTRQGKVLRSLSLDELPELWNILVGDMSLVGPRPLLMDYLSLYTPEQARRHEVRPGLTGWAQVNGRNAITWEERFVLDTWYVDNRSILLDLKIILMTFARLLYPRDISAEGHVTMPRFQGSKSEDARP